jgi:hypothetical protein
MFGAIATLGALIQRGVTGRGMEVQSALYENNVFLMGQHMLQFAVTGRHPAPMPARDNPWAIYDVFTVAGGEQIFLAAVSEAQWIVFCDVLGLGDLKSDRRTPPTTSVVLRPQLSRSCVRVSPIAAPPIWPRRWSAPACRSRRFASRKICTTIRISKRPAGSPTCACPTARKPVKPSRRRCFPS